MNEITVKIPVTAAKALMIYGIQLSKMNEKCEPEVSRGLEEATHNIWYALTKAGEINKLNNWVASEINKKKLND